MPSGSRAALWVIAASWVLCACNAVFDIESPVHADAGADGDIDGGIDTTDMVRVSAGSFSFGDPGTQATLSRDFFVDVHEVTVGRFARWVDAGQPAPCQTGSCSLDPGGPYDGRISWDAAWSSFAASDSYGEASECTQAMEFPDPPLSYSGEETLPMNCVTWYHAVAFCAFEHKRLLTETEWEYLAGYGHPTAPYPWGAEAPDCAHAIFNLGDVPAENGCGFPKPVGSAPEGISELEVHDLGGSVFEWTWDWHAPYPTASLTDYVGAAEPEDPVMPSRITRGGSWAAAADFLDVHYRDFTYLDKNFGDIGIRCAASAE